MQYINYFSISGMHQKVLKWPSLLPLMRILSLPLHSECIFWGVCEMWIQLFWYRRSFRKFSFDFEFFMEKLKGLSTLLASVWKTPCWIRKETILHIFSRAVFQTIGFLLVSSVVCCICCCTIEAALLSKSPDMGTVRAWVRKKECAIALSLLLCARPSSFLVSSARC